MAPKTCLQRPFLALQDSARNMRFSINFFTSIGLGGLTDVLRQRLKDLPALLLAQKAKEAPPESESGSGSDSDSDSDSSDSSSTDVSSSSSDSSDSDSASRYVSGAYSRAFGAAIFLFPAKRSLRSAIPGIASFAWLDTIRSRSLVFSRVNDGRI